MGIWERVAKAVQEKAGLSESQYCTSLEKQENTIIDFLSFNCYLEPDISPEIWTIKREILELYTKEIAALISKIEVYSHTLHANTVEAIYNLLQYIIASEFAADVFESKRFYNNTLSYAYYLKFAFQKSLSELYFDRIKSYKKMIKNFNHRGVLIGQQPLIDVLDEQTKCARKLYHSTRKKLRTRIRKNKQGEAELDLHVMDKDIGFDVLLSELEDVLQSYEQGIPNIIGNGYNMSTGYRLVSRIIALISGVFLLHGFLRLYGLWHPLIDFCVSLF